MSDNFSWLNKNSFLLATHSPADADGLGAMLALGSSLEQQGKSVSYLAPEVSKNLYFLIREKTILKAAVSPAAFEAVVVLDCANPDLAKIENLTARDRSWLLVNIDHHPDNRNFGDFNLVKTESAATAEIIYNLLQEKNWPVSGFAATALLAGLMFDTGSFQHTNTTAEVYRCAAELLQAGARLNEIARYLYAHRDETQIKALSYVLEQARYDENSGAIVAAVTKDDLTRLGVEAEDFEGAVEILNTFPRARLAALGRQHGGEVKFSLRSEPEKGVDVSALAAKFGGGGHKLAAGFRIPGELRRDNDTVYIVAKDLE